jgi:phosphoheptose isomerase
MEQARESVQSPAPLTGTTSLAVLRHLSERYPDLAPCLPAIEGAYELLATSLRQGGKVLLCGNGGSAADCDHIVGELMKGFTRRRPVSEAVRQQLLAAYPHVGTELADGLQGALPAIALASHTSLNTAIANDTAWDMAFAQQVFGYGRAGDVLIGISTSGNARNVIRALQVARALDLHTVGLTGRSGGGMAGLCDALILVPYDQTADVQERHLPVYHALCRMLEEAFFPV